MSIPNDLHYNKTHEWVRVDGDQAVIGISHFAQESLGDITFVDLPEVGTSLEQGQEFGSVESVKAASDLYSPVTGEVVAVNEALMAAPEIVNRSPFDEGWMVRVTLAAQPSGLLNAAEYEKACAEEAH